MGTYKRADVRFERGEGVWLFAEDGEKYLDFGSGVAVNSLGHAHPHLVEALTEQAGKLWHTSNLYRIAEQERFASRLAAHSFADRVFFCNSGAEACEGAIKAARRYHHAAGHPERTRIVTFTGAFHGRTLTALSAAGNEKHLEGFGEPAPGFDHVPFGDHDALRAAISGETAAIMVEPVQGEGGVRVVPPQCLEGLRELCDEHGLLLVFDEVQTGIGRTGRLFAYQETNIAPDILAVAKGLGGGFPVGAILTTEAVGAAMEPGTHGSTFGGNPLAMAVGIAVLDVVLDEGFLDTVRDRATGLRQRLAELEDAFPDIIEEVRQKGLLIGLKLKQGFEPGRLVASALAQHLLLVGASDNVVRLLPPLIVSEEECGLAMDRLRTALENERASHQS